MTINKFKEGQEVFIKGRIDPDPSKLPNRKYEAYRVLVDSMGSTAIVWANESNLAKRNND